MTRPSPFSVRGRRALMVMRDEREISIVRRQLNRLGMTISEHDPNEASPPDEAVDVIVLDADSIPIKSELASAWKSRAPIIALIGTETPSRLKWLLDLQPASFLVKPLRSAGLYTALVVAFDSAQRRIRPSRKTGRPHSLPAGGFRCRPPDHARSRALRDGRVCADPADGDAASHDRRAIERRDRRARRNAEPEHANRVIGPSR
jgi:hypothetical protein